ncbi:hypothetical protein PENVUL_c006G10377 [Penicillium vulpinum]|uniref:Uncharacterized protein n=1 Tax=Penicillium vulpinum TaxID=29845 RepID=A0A1V6S765_9EURO|nr:hypothetical protein PENVUL_c006G10377 [Penicillium vulpinum]
MAHMTKAATPPTTPPIIAPRFEDAPPGVLDEVLVADALAARTEPVTPVAADVSELVETSEAVSVTRETGDVSEAVDVFEPADISEVIEEAVADGTSAVVELVLDSDKVEIEEVVVLGVTSGGNRPITPTVVNERVEDLVDVVLASSSPSSGQMPVVHGSLEQHPRKLPAVQTYHSLPPVQAVDSRGIRDPRDSRDSISNTILKDQVSSTESEDNSIKSQDTHKIAQLEVRDLVLSTFRRFEDLLAELT